MSATATIAPIPSTPPSKIVSATTRPRPAVCDSPSELVGDLTSGRVPLDASSAETSFRAALKGYGDSACRVCALANMCPGLTTPGEEEFAAKLTTILTTAGASVADWMDIVHDDELSAPLPRRLRNETRTKIVAVNAFKALSAVGIKAGPAFVQHTKFTLWRPATWRNRKIVPGVVFVGVGDVARVGSPKAQHPFDFVRSTR